MVAGGLHVSVSHSGDIVVVALCAEAEIGVDVEQIISAHPADANLPAVFSSRQICLAAIEVPAGYRAVLATFAAGCRIDYRKVRSRPDSVISYPTNFPCDA